MKISIYSQHAEKHTHSVLYNLFDLKNNYKLDFFIEKEFSKLLNQDFNLKFNYETFSSYNDLDNSFDLMITIGGDGTLLRSISFIRDLEIPIIGINTGRLGFLATLNQDLLKTELKKIIKREFQVEERTLLEVNCDSEIENNDFTFALNEVTVSRKNTTSLIKIKTKRGEKSKPPADGI